MWYKWLWLLEAEAKINVFPTPRLGVRRIEAQCGPRHDEIGRHTPTGFAVNWVARNFKHEGQVAQEHGRVLDGQLVGTATPAARELHHAHETQNGAAVAAAVVLLLLLYV